MSHDFIHVDPARQRDFLESLNRRMYAIEQQIDLVGSRMGMLGREWRDDEFLQFKASIEQTRVLLKSFIEEGRDVANVLARLADLGDDYQKIRLGR